MQEWIYDRTADYLLRTYLINHSSKSLQGFANPNLFESAALLVVVEDIVRIVQDELAFYYTVL